MSPKFPFYSKNIACESVDDLSIVVLVAPIGVISYLVLFISSELYKRNLMVVFCALNCFILGLHGAQEIVDRSFQRFPLGYTVYILERIELNVVFLGVFCISLWDDILAIVIAMVAITIIPLVFIIIIAYLSEGAILIEYPILCPVVQVVNFIILQATAQKRIIHRTGCIQHQHDIQRRSFGLGGHDIAGIGPPWSADNYHLHFEKQIC